MSFQIRIIYSGDTAWRDVSQTSQPKRGGGEAEGEEKEQESLIVSHNVLWGHTDGDAAAALVSVSDRFIIYKELKK